LFKIPYLDEIRGMCRAACPQREQIDDICRQTGKAKNRPGAAASQVYDSRSITKLPYLPKHGPRGKSLFVNAADCSQPLKADAPAMKQQPETRE
jgi:hypothetical protein